MFGVMIFGDPFGITPAFQRAIGATAVHSAVLISRDTSTILRSKGR